MILKKPPRKKTCPICSVRYQPTRSIQPTCGTFRCELAFATQRSIARQERRDAYALDLERRGKLGLLMTLPEAREKAQAAFNTWVRLRDADRPCISCGEPNPPQRFGGAWDAGHYLTIGAHPELRFEPKNAHKQCKACNRPGGCRRADYRAGLVARIGEADVLWLEGPHEPRRFRLEDFLAEKLKWLAAARELRKAMKLKSQPPAVHGGEV